jgi:cob(I)alamin adenosyltransferase
LRITRVYTKTGDKGTTGLVGGKRVPKFHDRIEAYGTGDELMSVLGWVREELKADQSMFTDPGSYDLLDKLLEYLQNDLFTLNSELATCPEDLVEGMPVMTAGKVAFLEQVCDQYNQSLPPLKEFILPGGSRTAMSLHMARTVSRRLERVVCHLSESETVGENLKVYINRLSDVFFILARWVNLQMNQPEVSWKRDLGTPDLPSG